MPANRRKGNKSPLPDPDNSTQVSFIMDKDQHLTLKIYCTTNERDLSDIFREAAAQFCKEENLGVGL